MAPAAACPTGRTKRSGRESDFARSTDCAARRRPPRADRCPPVLARSRLGGKTCTPRGTPHPSGRGSLCAARTRWRRAETIGNASTPDARCQAAQTAPARRGFGLIGRPAQSAQTAPLWTASAPRPLAGHRASVDPTGPARARVAPQSRAQSARPPSAAPPSGYAATAAPAPARSH